MRRRNHSDELKAKVVLEALRGVDTANVIGKRYGVHPLMVAKWKKQAVELLPTLFSKENKGEKEQWQRREAELFQQIGQLKYELDWVKKKASLFSD